MIFSSYFFSHTNDRSIFSNSKISFFFGGGAPESKKKSKLLYGGSVAQEKLSNALKIRIELTNW